MSTPKEPQVIVHLGLPQDLLGRIRADAKARDTSMSRIIRELVRLGYLAKDMQKPGAPPSTGGAECV